MESENRIRDSGVEILHSQESELVLELTVKKMTSIRIIQPDSGENKNP